MSTPAVAAVKVGATCNAKGQVNPLFKGLIYIQGLDIELGFTYMCGW